MVLLEVMIPHGLRAGDTMSVEGPDGLAYDVVIPMGLRGGMSMEVDLPGGPEPGASAAQQVEVVVPDGIHAGEAFTVEFDGTSFEIVCPDGCGAGSAILIDVPVTTPPAEPPAAEPPPPPDHFKFKPGQRVELIRSGKDSEEVTSSGTIVEGFEGVFDVCYKIRLDNGLCKEAVPEDDISGELTSDMGDLFGDW